MKKIIRRLILLFILAGLLSDMLQICVTFGKVMNLTKGINETAAFRNLRLSEAALGALKEVNVSQGVSVGNLIAAWMPENQFALTRSDGLSVEHYQEWSGLFLKYRPDEYRDLISSYQAIFDDLVYFPVSIPVNYCDSWMAARTYGGERRHEGCDLMPPHNMRGQYPILSMTDGIVEEIGWLEQGGYRLGIRSPHGGYFYYAHLASYAVAFHQGDVIKAGTLLGYMGDSGYSKVEGTTGKFDVHLHLGIYIKTAHHQEVSVNPYWVLRYLEGYKLKYKYYL